MMKQIWKYPLSSTVNDISCPKGAIPRAFQLQNGVPTLWMEVDHSQPYDVIEVHVMGTGDDFTADNMQYVGTVQDGYFVIHCYVQESNNECYLVSDVMEDGRKDFNAATRRAIVRAAASLSPQHRSEE